MGLPTGTSPEKNRAFAASADFGESGIAETERFGGLAPV
jgi:hypothetical protein